ncbi:MAG: inositol monophosphatase family protein [Leptospiraceae bacterium]|nr:inositol monophosphatase family protein [Leptospiraceae bacterium]
MSSQEVDVSSRVKLALSLATKVSKFLISIQKKPSFIIEKKGSIDLVTEADKGSEKILRHGILSKFPKDSILGEEEGSVENSGDYRWILDPLDGTTNFSHRLPLYAVSIGIEHKETKQVLGGVISLPALGDTYYAEKNKGAFKNKKQIKVSDTVNLIDALFCTGFPYQRENETDRIISYLKNLLLKTRGVRRTGAAALDLAWVAEGRFDGFWEERLSPWDMAAGGLIILEAGGSVTTFDGNSFSPYIPNIIATNSKLHDLARQELTFTIQDSLEHY